VIVRFIEFMDVGNRNDWSPDKVVPSAKLAARIGSALADAPVSPATTRAKWPQRWRFDDGAAKSASSRR
jgi:GTP 3',8-cyclase